MEELLKELEFDVKLCGYNYWKELIELAYNEYTKRGIYKFKLDDLYIEIAERHNETRDRLERNLRTVVGKSKQRIRDYFRYYSYSISNKTVLCLILGEMKRLDGK